MIPEKDRSWSEINLDHFEYNLEQLKSLLNNSENFMQIVKADAYGHGAFEIAESALRNGAVMLGVANCDEGMLLRYQQVNCPILILSPSFSDEISKIVNNNLTPSISNLDFAINLNNYCVSLNKEIMVHINLDTGMGRSGIEAEFAMDLIRSVINLSNLKIEGIFSHFAASESDLLFTQKQTNRFKRILDSLNFKPCYIHISNSSGVVTAENDFCNLVRFGILSFGIYTSKTIREKVDIKPVMSFKSRLSQIKTAKVGESIGYNQTFVTNRPLRYAIIPVGYADGYDFMLSNLSQVLLRDELCPVIGRISMDMIAVDISGVPEAQVDDIVTLLGDHPDEITAENLATLYNGSSYELISQIGRRAKRYFLKDDKIKTSEPILRRDFVSSDFPDTKLNLVIESAITQRLQSREVANLVYDEILRKLFADKDKDISYRKDFKHEIVFTESTEFPEYYRTTTTLQFNKKITHDYFYVVCANSSSELARYFLRNDVEYRWLLDENVLLSEKMFTITDARINGIPLDYNIKVNNSCLEIFFTSEKIKDLIGQEVNFSISTETFYPRKNHQLTVYISELTKGVHISFKHVKNAENIEIIQIFSGQKKFPEIISENNILLIKTSSNEWIFPNSGVVFAY
ncbi:MAG: alanine racemase [Candidatus Cloacimonetes bacterium]|nr:alanine racemase [Candidatus Cloacimonadota bacterium]